MFPDLSESAMRTAKAVAAKDYGAYGEEWSDSYIKHVAETIELEMHMIFKDAYARGVKSTKEWQDLHNVA
jgi:hypothetical protein